MSEKYYNVAQIAKKIGVSTRTVHRYLKEQRFEHLIIIKHPQRNHYIFTQSTVRAYENKYGKMFEDDKPVKRTYNKRLKKYSRGKKKASK